MGMKLWRSIAVHWPGGIVFKLRHSELARSFSRMIAADPRLRVPLQLVKSYADALPVRFADTFIAADKRGERDRFGRGKGRIPPGSVLHRLDGLAVGILIFIRRSLSHKLLDGLGMLAQAEFREVLGRDRSGKAELPG